ncbi:MAG: FG-GAP repeat protein [Halofilum sp. (in: g-proteobacteria)]|nr:FG-GAP repeat protein [Halofilum sp. (in: g-proteobacteria)]
MKASDRAGGDVFGVSVALSEDGDTLAVGAMGKDTSAGDEGVAYVFTRSSGSWSEQDIVESASPENNDLFGYRVALSADGTTLAVGAEQDGATDRPPGAGAVFVYTEGPTDDWQFDQEIVQPTPLSASRFGSALALSDAATRWRRVRADEDGRGEVHVFVRASGHVCVPGLAGGVERRLGRSLRRGAGAVGRW